jgi:Domain of unknown function (DUF4276)
MIEKLIIFVEEYSMEKALEYLLPPIIGDVNLQIIRFQCKDDLLKSAPAQLKGYASWLPKNWRIIVLVDRDDDDFHALKSRLEGIARSAGLLTKTSPARSGDFQVVTRIAIEELESWFFGDWTAVQEAYPKVPSTIPQKAGFRDPDAIAGGTWEAMERVLKKAGYFPTGLRKAELSQAVASRMDPSRNRSRSFQTFINGVAAAII